MVENMSWKNVFFVHTPTEHKCIHAGKKILHYCCLDEASHLNIPSCKRLPQSLSAYPSISQVEKEQKSVKDLCVCVCVFGCLSVSLPPSNSLCPSRLIFKCKQVFSALHVPEVCSDLVCRE